MDAGLIRGRLTLLADVGLDVVLRLRHDLFEIARLALTKLVTDGRIHPARIEEIVAKAKHDV